MKVWFQTYLQFMLAADVLTRELGLTQVEASELLAKVCGYKSHTCMPVSPGYIEEPIPRTLIISRLQSLRPDMHATLAGELIDTMKLPGMY